MTSPGSPPPGDSTAATLRRVGDVWTIDDGRTRLHLNNGRGVRLLALLLAHPGKEIHSLDLVAIVDGTTRLGAGAAPRAEDPQTARFGLGGRDRSESGSHAERARVNVTRSIRSTVKRIAGYDARLGRELEACIRTGTFCAYQPDPRHPVRWVVDDAGTA
jgi:hypothetical protein